LYPYTHHWSLHTRYNSDPCSYSNCRPDADGIANEHVELDSVADGHTNINSNSNGQAF
jgi:hypothetical protein